MRVRVMLLGSGALFLISSLIIFTSRPAMAGRASSGASDTPTPSSLHDDLQRSYRTDKYLEVAGSGAARGENIYWHKCWVCHNNTSQPHPRLRDYLSAPH